MELIRCNAFKMHGCMKKATQAPLICCHSCRCYDECEVRCQNKPRSCGMGKVTDAELHKPFEETLKRKTKRVAKYDADTGELIAVFESIKDAANSVEDGPFASRAALIGKCANGIQKTAKGYVWKFV